MLEGIGLAAIWSVIPLAIGPQATAGAALGLWVLISLLMTASAVALAGLPLATLAFLGFPGTSVTPLLDRQSVVEGKRGSVRVDLGGSRIFKQKIETPRCQI